MDSPTLMRLCLNGRTIDFRRGTLTGGSGQSIALRPQAMEVLKLLAARPGVLIGKDELIRSVWGDIAVTDDSLVQCITDIRKALGDEAHEIVRTIPRRGYVLEVPPPEQPPAPIGRWSRRSVLATAAAGLAALVALAAAYWWIAPEPAPGRPPSIAVLPFDDMSAEQTLGYMGDGVAEDIIAMLARQPDVLVMARNSSFAFKGKASDIRRIGQKLGADYVLEGSVRREGQKLRIVAQLNDTRTGEHLWAERFDKAGTDPWALQDEVTGRIIGSLIGEKGELKRAQYRQAWGKDSGDLAEYDYYLRGLDLYMNADEKPQYDQARDIWLEGLRRYPGSMLLKVKLGWYHFTIAWDFVSDDAPADFAAADRLVSEVLASGPLSPEVRRAAHWLNAHVLMQRGEFERSVAESEFAMALAPYDARMLRTLSDVLVAAGRYEMALAWLEEAAPREPGVQRRYHASRGYIYRMMGRYDDAIREYQQARPLLTYQLPPYIVALVRVGRLDDASDGVADLLGNAPDFTVARWREAAFYSDPKILEEESADLARAGLPEK